MICPSCSSGSVRVTDSRPADGGATRRRRRLCMTCAHSWVTIETDADQAPTDRVGRMMRQDGPGRARRPGGDYPSR